VLQNTPGTFYAKGAVFSTAPTYSAYHILPPEVNSFLCRRRIIAARRQIKRIRKVSDKEIFDATMRMPPLKTLIAKI
jgi:hypothetical protein